MMNKRDLADKDRIIQELREENELKTKWIALLVHDFKGLFSNIQWLLNAYENKVISEEIFLKMLPEINQQLERNQNTFLDTTEWLGVQMKRGNVGITEMNVFELFAIIKEELKESLFKKKITIGFIGDSSMILHSDKVLTLFILRKVIENAIKYSYPSGHISFEPVSHATHLRIRIKDQGVGMEAKVMESLFTLNGNPCTGTKNEKGVGISLILAKDFICRLGGEIKAFSEGNEHTVFELSFPVLE